MKSQFTLLAVIGLASITPVLAEDISDFYSIEEIAIPPELDPQVHALTTLEDGRVVAGFHRGQIAIWNPVDNTWKIFAEGLHEPLGIIAVSESEFLVMQRPELTRIKDTDGDGEADQFETVFDDFGLSGNYHEFAFGPLLAPDGDVFISLNVASNGATVNREVRGEWSPIGMPRETFYSDDWKKVKNEAGRMYSRVGYRGWVLKVNLESGKAIPWACGMRSPNGLGFDAQGNLFVSDNQGDWLGASKLHHVKKDRFHGHPASLVWREGWTKNPLDLTVEELEELRTPASVLFPQGILANSPTQPLLIQSEGRFGPFDGQMLIGEMNRARIVRLMMEEIDGTIQGAGVPFIDDHGLDQGNNRLAWSPDRKTLYVGQTHLSWAGGQGLQKITWNGKTSPDIADLHLTKGGFQLKFTTPMDAASLKSGANIKVKSYRFNYHQEYGSDQMDSHDHMIEVRSVSDDGLTAEIALDRMKAGYVYEFHLDDLKTAAGGSLMNNLVCYTALKLVD